MQLEKASIRIKCDTQGCSNLATHTLKLKRFFNLGDTNFCKKCLSEMHREISKIITPKSPKNVLTKTKQNKEVKK